MVPGVYAIAPVLSAWMANNSEPYYRRATSVAFGFIATNSVCFVPFIKYIYHYYYLFTFDFISGRYFEYMEFPNQRRTKIQENNNHEPHFVSVHSPFSFVTLPPLAMPFF